MKKGDKKSRVAEIAAALGFTSVDQEEEEEGEGEVYQAGKDLDQLRINAEALYGNGKNPERYESSLKWIEERRKELLERENNHNSD